MKPPSILEQGINKMIEFDTVGGCWLWLGHITNSGYGSATILGHRISAHRLSFESTFGPVPDGMGVLHKCDVRSCVNPDHLYAGTNRQNVDDRLRRMGCDPAILHRRSDRDIIHLHPSRRPYAKSGKPRRKPAPDSRHGTNRVLTTDQVREIRASNGRGCDLARQYGVAPGTISKIRSGQLWTTLPA